MRRSRSGPYGLAAMVVLLLACSKLTDPTATEPPPPAPDPNGVVLSGEPADPALGALAALPPSPAPRNEISGGLFTTRLTAVIAPGATVGQVNDALAASGARIISMAPDLPVLSLKIPPVQDLAAAEAAAAEIGGDPAFVFAFPDFEPEPPALTDGSTEPRQTLLPPSGIASIEHLIAARVPAAWNAAELARSQNQPVTVMIADKFVSKTTLPGIAGTASFVGRGDASAAPSGYPAEPGNHGVHVTSIIGAPFDDDPVTGLHPVPSLLRFRILPIEGLTDFEIGREIAANLPAGDRIILNTSLAETGVPSLNGYKLKLFFSSIVWRALAASNFNRFFHATAAGNRRGAQGDLAEARFNSQFTAARFFGDLRGILDQVSVGADTLAAADSLWQRLATHFPEALAPSANLLAVGSSSTTGTESPTSSRGSDVRTVGEDVAGRCVVQDPAFAADTNACDGSVARYSGTSMASPQVAALAAYLWTLDPRLTVAQLKTAITHAYDNSITTGLVDAYLAVLALDRSLADAPVRRTLLDVAGTNPTPGSNGRFDEHDLELFLERFAHYDGVRSGGNFDSDHSRYDLNGDGFTGSLLAPTVAMDLDVQHLTPSFSTVSQSIEGVVTPFDETSVSDLDALCYYAYSSLYEGDVESRTELLADCLGEGAAVPSRRVSDVDAEVDFGSVDPSDSDGYEGFAQAEIMAEIPEMSMSSGGDNVTGSASATQISYLTTNGEGELTEIGGQGTARAAAETTLEDGLRSHASAVSDFRVVFEVQGGSMEYELTATLSGTATDARIGQPAQAPGAGGVAAARSGFEGAGYHVSLRAFGILADLTQDTGGGTESMSESGVLPPGTHSFDVDAIAAVFFDFAAGAGTSQASFDVTVTLRPLTEAARAVVVR